MIAIDQMQSTRVLLAGLGDGFGNSIDKIPAGFGNHPLWNLGHLVVTTGLLVYRLSGLDLGMPESMVEDFGKGSDPKTWTATHSWADIKQQLLAQPAQLRKDWDDGLFQEFKRYETSIGIVLENVEQAITYNTFHEGTHLGYALAQRKALAGA
ncbi:MAG: hypothetical protein ACI9HE_003571 [Planctomycetota bacterium]|jgi:hypothetical protein